MDVVLLNITKCIAVALIMSVYHSISRALSHTSASVSEAIAKNPAAKDDLFTYGMLSLVMIEALGLFTMVACALVIFMI